MTHQFRKSISSGLSCSYNVTKTDVSFVLLVSSCFSLVCDSIRFAEYILIRLYVPHTTYNLKWFPMPNFFFVVRLQNEWYTLFIVIHIYYHHWQPHKLHKYYIYCGCSVHALQNTSQCCFSSIWHYTVVNKFSKMFFSFLPALTAQIIIANMHFSIPHRITYHFDVYYVYTKQQAWSLILFIFLQSTQGIHKIHFQDTRSPLAMPYT